MKTESEIIKWEVQAQPLRFVDQSLFDLIDTATGDRLATFDNQEAATLAAAAPRMKAALEQARSYFQANAIWGTTRANVDLAIAAGEGTEVP